MLDAVLTVGMLMLHRRSACARFGAIGTTSDGSGSPVLPTGKFPPCRICLLSSESHDYPDEAFAVSPRDEDVSPLEQFPMVFGRGVLIGGVDDLRLFRSGFHSQMLALRSASK